MPSYSGVWNLNAQLQAYAAQNWPQGPGAPTSVSATAGDASATVSFTAPTFTGVPPGITGYRAISSPGGFAATGASSPLTVTGLTNGTAYTFNVQATNGVQYGPAGTSGSVTPSAPRGVFGGGYTGSNSNVIQYVSMTTSGNAIDFGDLLLATNAAGACASATRGVVAGGSGGGNVIQYVTIATTGNATDFGDFSSTIAGGIAGCNSTTRGLFAGITSDARTIEYITIASTGNSVNFGLLTARQEVTSSASSSTRGVWAGGANSDIGTQVNRIEYVTISSVGNAIDFGDLTIARGDLAGGSSGVRAVFGGGANASSFFALIDYITIASTGDAITFGNLTSSRAALGCAASSIQAIWAGGQGSGGRVNIIDFVTIATTGNATDFGDLIQPTDGSPAGFSNVNGGLQ